MTTRTWRTTRWLLEKTQPYFLTVSLGTTNTCAVDDFASIAEVKKDYPDIWIHVDAAYAGVALSYWKEEYQSSSLGGGFKKNIFEALEEWCS